MFMQCGMVFYLVWYWPSDRPVQNPVQFGNKVDTMTHVIIHSGDRHVGSWCRGTTLCSGTVGECEVNWQSGPWFQAVISSLSGHLTADAEITLEANPTSATGHSLEAFRQAGVNRLSLGVQVSHASESALNNRLHVGSLWYSFAPNQEMAVFCF